MTENKGRKDQGGFFEDEEDEDYLSESTVVDGEVLKKLSPETAAAGADVLEEVDVLGEAYEPPVAESPAPKPALAAMAAPAPLPKAQSKHDKLDQVASLLSQSDVQDDDKTIILPDKEIQGMPEAPTGGKLVVIEGPDEGKEYALTFNEVFVGRSVDNDFVVADRAMSRKHFRIRRRFDEYIVGDLESGNGTRLNEKRIEEEVLHHGDILSAGRSTFRFVDMTLEQQEAAPLVEAPKPAPAAPAPVPAAAPPAPKAEEAKPILTAKPEAPKPAPAQPPKAEAPKPAPAQPPKVEAPKPAPAQPPKTEAPKPAPAPIPATKPAPTKPEAAKAAKAPEAQKPAQKPSVAPVHPAKAAPKPAPAKPATPTAKSEAQKGGSGAWIAIVVVLIVLVALGVVYKQSKKSAAPVAPVAPAPVVDVKQVEVDKLMAEAKSNMTNKFFAKAAEAADKVLVLAPGHNEATTLREKAKSEEAARTALEEGKGLVGQKQFDKALERLKSLNPQSSFLAEAKAVIAGIYETKYGAELAKGKKLLEAKKYDAVQSLCDSLLNKAPDFEAATALKNSAAQAKTAIDDAKNAGKKEAEKRAEEEKAKREEEKAKREEEKRKAADDAKRRKDEEKQKQDDTAKARPTASAADIDKGLSYYKSGRREDAMLTLLETSRGQGPVADRAKRIVGDMKSFNDSYDTATRAIAAKDAVKAIGALKEAMRLDQNIATGSTFAGELKTKMADMFTLIGNQEKAKDQFENAQKAYTKALQFVPGHAAAKAGLDSLGDSAKRLYYEGFAAKEKNPSLAKSKWQQVLKIAQPGSEWYKKASAELEDME